MNRLYRYYIYRQIERGADKQVDGMTIDLLIRFDKTMDTWGIQPQRLQREKKFNFKFVVARNRFLSNLNIKLKENKIFAHYDENHSMIYFK